MDAIRDALYSDLQHQADRLDDEERHRLREAIDRARHYEDICASLVRTRDDMDKRIEAANRDLDVALGKLAAEKDDIVAKLLEAENSLNEIGSKNSSNTTTLRNLSEIADHIEESTAALQSTA